MNRLFRAFLIALLLVGLASDAWALSMGFFLESGGGSGSADIEPSYVPFDDYKTDFDASYGALGFVLDTDAGNKGIFNYRLHLGLEAFKYEPDRGSDADLGGFTVTQDFGFSFVRTPSLRVWAGPELKLGLYGGESDDDADITAAFVGLGPVVGINFRLSKSLYLALKGGVLGVAFGGEGEYPNGNTYDITGDIGLGLFNFSLLFGLE